MVRRAAIAFVTATATATATAVAAASTVVPKLAFAQVVPLTPFATQKAEALLRDKYSCLGCHRLRGSGGMLAPELSDVRQRRSPAYIAAIVVDPARTAPGVAMPRIAMPRSERTLIVRYLGGDTAALAPPPVRVVLARDTSVRALYGAWCAGCHGVAGGGDGANARYLPVPPARHSDAVAMATRSDDALFDTIHGGGTIMNRSARMPAFGGSLAAPDILRLVRYIRALCRCEGPAWSVRVRGL